MAIIRFIDAPIYNEDGSLANQDYRVIAVGENGVESAASDVITLSTPPDTTPPPVPSAPIVAALYGTYVVSWDGLGDAGQGMPFDFVDCEVQMATGAAGPWVAQGTLRNTQARVVITGLSGRNITRWFRLISQDRMLNRSVASATTESLLVPLVEAPDIQDELTIINQRYDGVIEDAALLDGKVTQARTDLDASVVRLTTAEGKVAEIENTTIPGLNTRLAGAEGNISTLTTTTIPGLDNRLDTAETDLSNARTRLTTAEGEISTLNTTTIPGLNSDITAAETRLTSAETRLTSAEGDVTTLQDTTIPALNTRLTTAEGELNTAEQNITAAQGEINTLKNTTIPALDGELTAAEGRITTAEGTLTKKLDQVTGLPGNKVFHDVLNGYHSTASSSDFLVIQTKIGVTSSVMARIKIEGSELARNGTIDVDLSFYAYNYNGGTIHGPYVSSDGARQVGVQLATDVNNNIAIILTPIGGTWAYLRISVPEYQMGFANIPASAVGWTSAFVTDLAAYTRLVTPASRDLDDTHTLTQGWRATGTVEINGGKIKADTVTALQILAKTITAGEIATGALTSASGIFGTVDASILNAGTLNAARLNAADVRAKFIEAGKITAVDIVAGTLTSASGVFGTMDASVINAGTLSTLRLNANDLRAHVLSAGKITAVDIVAGTLTSASGVFGTMDASVINAGTLSTLRLNAVNLRAHVLSAGKITAADMVTGTLTAASAVIASLDASKLTVGTVAADRLDAATVRAKFIAAGKVAAVDIVAGTLTSASGVFGTMDASVINAGTLNTARLNTVDIAAATAAIQTVDVKNLFVTAGATMQTAVIDKLWTDVVMSKKITTNMLAVGDFNNLWTNGNGQDGDNIGPWPTVMVPDAVDKPTGVALAFKTPAGQGSVFSGSADLFDVEAGAEYLFQVWLKADLPGSRVYLELRDQDGAHAGVAKAYKSYPMGTSAGSPYPIANHLVPTVWTKYYAVMTMSATAHKVNLGTWYFNHANGTERNAVVYAAGGALMKRADGQVLVDGSVKAESLDVDSLTANTALMNAIQAETVTAGSVSGLTITGSIIQTSAASATGIKINSNGLFAYNTLGGTTLTVDSTTGDVQVYGGTFTSPTIQTESAASRGVKFTSSGLYAYSPTGENTLTVSAATGAANIVGRIVTGMTGDRRWALVPEEGGRIGLWMVNAGAAGIGGSETGGIWYEPLDQSLGSSNWMNMRGTNGGGVQMYGTTILNGQLNCETIIMDTKNADNNWGFQFQMANGSYFGASLDVKGRFYNSGHSTTTQMANTFIQSADGAIFRSTSASRYKLDQQEMVLDDSLLDVPVKDWIDRVQSERREELTAMMGPLSEHDTAELESLRELRRIPGVVAEEVEAVDARFTTYEDDGTVEGVAYERLALAQIQVLKRQLDLALARITTLEAN